MKIKTIVAENFKRHEHLTIPMDKKNLALVGVNGAGKSSVLQIIKYALTGEADKNMINRDYNYMSVGTKLENGTVFERQMFTANPSKVKVNGKNATGVALGDLLKDYTGVKTDVMKIVTSGEVIESMKPDQFGKFLLGYIPEELDIDTIIKYADPLTSEEEAKMRELFPKMPDKFGISKIEEVFKDCQEIKKITKKNLEIKKANSKMYKGLAPTRTLEEVDEEMEDILKKEGSESAKIEAKKAYTNAKKTREMQEKQINALEKQIADIKATRPNPSEEKETQDKLMNAQKSLMDSKFILKQMEENVETFKEQLDNLDGSICPLAMGLVCTTDKTPLKEELTDKISATKEGIEIQKGKISEEELEVASLQKRVTEFTKQKLDYQKKVLLINNLETLKKALIEVPEEPEEDPLDLSAEKEELKKERINIAQWEQHLKILKEIEFFENYLAVVATVADRLSPKGSVISEVTRYYTSEFENACNLRATALKKKMQVKFVPENGIQILAYNGKSKNPIPYAMLSSGEKAEILFLIMDMLNALTGLRILLMDDLEKLDDESFDALIALLMTEEVQNEYDNIVIAMVNHKDAIKTLKSYKEMEVIEL